MASLIKSGKCMLPLKGRLVCSGLEAVYDFIKKSGALKEMALPLNSLVQGTPYLKV